MRCGLIAKKIGMTRIFNDDGNSIPVSVLKMDNCVVISKKNKSNSWLRRITNRIW